MSKHFDKRHSKTPSFSTILLDSIYRSMDSNDVVQRNTESPPSIAVDRQYCPPTEKSVNLKRAIMIDHWIEKQQEQEEQEEEEKKKNRRKPNRRRGASLSDSDFGSCFTPFASRSSQSSPSSKIASFINSIFTGNRSKPQRPPVSGRRLKTPAAPSKRSVRFYNLSLIAGEDDSRDCGHKSLKSGKVTKIPDGVRSSPWCLPEKKPNNEGEEDDAESYASSDLFELPVYGTTSLEMNKAIANGFLL